MTAHNSIHSQIKGLYTCYDVSLQAISNIQVFWSKKKLLHERQCLALFYA